MSKKHAAAGKYLNPPFDPRIRTIANGKLGASKLQRGRLVAATADTATGMKHGVHFLYNPVAVSVSHNVTDQIVNGANFGQTGGETGQMGTTVNIGGLSVDLLYDRTYELWDRSKRNTLAGRFGVYSDVLAFYMLLGITPDGTTSSGGSVHSGGVQNDTGNEVTTKTWQSLYPQRPISTSTMLYLYIGDKMRFYGMLTSFSITYSHWNEEMIPTRCQVSLSLAFQVDPNTVNKTINRHKLTSTHLPGSGGNG